MDFNSLKNQVSNLTLYDLKAGVRKVQNAVMNHTEMEAKVREATNNDPWGTSSSAMQEIALATQNYQLLNEIMPMIYKRFTDKTAEEWRQIYKALQLLEFLVKHGSERVIDDVRSHMSLLKMLRQFYYTDPSGKDQGVNVRHRSKELVELLGDVERIRTERKKARAQSSKTLGAVSSSSGLGGRDYGGSSRHGGFGSESTGYGGFSGGVYGDGGGFGGNAANDSYGTSSKDRTDDYEEYNEFDEGAAETARDTRRRPEATRTTKSIRAKKQPDPPKPKEPEVDLFDFGDDDLVQPSVLSTKPSGSQAQQGGAMDDDDFDDFQSAAAPPMHTMASFNTIPPPPPLTGASLAAPPPPSQTVQPASTLINPMTSTGAPITLPKTIGYQAATPNYFTSVSVQSATTLAPMNGKTTITSNSSSIGNGTGAQQKQAKATTTGGSGGDAFANLLGATNFKSKAKQGSAQGMSMQEMAKQKSSAGLWGPAPSSAATTPGVNTPSSNGMSLAPMNGADVGAANNRPTGGALDDLLG